MGLGQLSYRKVINRLVPWLCSLDTMKPQPVSRPAFNSAIGAGMILQLRSISKIQSLPVSTTYKPSIARPGAVTVAVHQSINTASAWLN
jgi:hypothetical protein